MIRWDIACHPLKIIPDDTSTQLTTLALDLQYLYIVWKFALLPAEAATPESILVHRTQLIEKCTEMALDSDLNVSLGIKRAAFRTLLEVALICKHRQAATRDPRDAIALSVQTQYQCAGFLQAEIDRYAAELARDGDDELLQETMDDEHVDERTDAATDGELQVCHLKHANETSKQAR